MVDPVAYIVCRKESTTKLVGFVRISGMCVIVTDNPYDDARKFLSEASAKAMAYELNNRPYSSGNWEVMELYI